MQSALALPSLTTRSAPTDAHVAAAVVGVVADAGGVCERNLVSVGRQTSKQTVRAEPAVPDSVPLAPLGHTVAIPKRAHATYA